jgi:hypothetical protein
MIDNEVIDFFELYETAREDLIVGGFEHDELDNDQQAYLYLYDVAIRLFGERDIEPGVFTATIVDNKWDHLPRLAITFPNNDKEVDPDTLPTMMYSPGIDLDVVVIYPAKNDPTGLVIEIRRMK